MSCETPVLLASNTPPLTTLASDSKLCPPDVKPWVSPVQRSTGEQQEQEMLLLHNTQPMSNPFQTRSFSVWKIALSRFSHSPVRVRTMGRHIQIMTCCFRPMLHLGQRTSQADSDQKTSQSTEGVFILDTCIISSCQKRLYGNFAFHLRKRSSSSTISIPDFHD